MNDNEIKLVFQFGGDAVGIDDLADKTLRGEKTATSSLYDYYVGGLKEMSRVGDLVRVVNSADETVCIVKITRIDIVLFGNITEEFARQEGDGSLDNWLSIHIPYYSEKLRAIGAELTPETRLLCEWFCVV